MLLAKSSRSICCNCDMKERSQKETEVKLWVYLDHSWKNMTSDQSYGLYRQRQHFLRKLQKAKWIKINNIIISLKFAAQNVFYKAQAVSNVLQIRTNNVPQTGIFEGEKVVQARGVYTPSLKSWFASENTRLGDLVHIKPWVI